MKKIEISHSQALSQNKTSMNFLIKILYPLMQKKLTNKIRTLEATNLSVEQKNQILKNACLLLCEKIFEIIKTFKNYSPSVNKFETNRFLLPKMANEDIIADIFFSYFNVRKEDFLKFFTEFKQKLLETIKSDHVDFAFNTQLVLSDKKLYIYV